MLTPFFNPRFRSALAVSLFAASAFVIAVPARAAADVPPYLACELSIGEQWLIVIENFGGVAGAVDHCLHDLNGHPLGLVR